MTATKADLRREIKELRNVGQQMSNICFNLAQNKEQPIRYRDSMDSVRKEWDAIKRAEKPNER